MKILKIKVVIFFTIFLILFGMFEIEVYSNKYDVGTNVITRDIEFRLNIQNSLLVAYDTHIDFGKILKGSTGKILGESKIRVESDSNVQYVSANYLSEKEDDGTYKVKMNYIENEKIREELGEKYNKTIDIIEKEEINVYFLPFDRSYELKSEQGKNIGEIPVKAEIREVGNARLGYYEGSIQVQVIAITSNDEEKKR